MTTNDNNNNNEVGDEDGRGDRRRGRLSRPYRSSSSESSIRFKSSSEDVTDRNRAPLFYGPGFELSMGDDKVMGKVTTCGGEDKRIVTFDSGGKLPTGKVSDDEVEYEEPTFPLTEANMTFEGVVFQDELSSNSFRHEIVSMSCRDVFDVVEQSVLPNMGVLDFIAHKGSDAFIDGTFCYMRKSAEFIMNLYPGKDGNGSSCWLEMQCTYGDPFCWQEFERRFKLEGEKLKLFEKVVDVFNDDMMLNSIYGSHGDDVIDLDAFGDNRGFDDLEENKEEASDGNEYEVECLDVLESVNGIKAGEMTDFQEYNLTSMANLLLADDKVSECMKKMIKEKYNKSLLKHLVAVVSNEHCGNSCIVYCVLEMVTFLLQNKKELNVVFDEVSFKQSIQGLKEKWSQDPETSVYYSQQIINECDNVLNQI